MRCTWLVACVLAFGLILGSLRVPAATTDLPSVRRALGGETDALTPAPDADARLVDTIAKSVTLRLGNGDADWKPTHPLWPSVYARVRADLERETPALTADFQAAAGRSVARLVSAVAAEVSPADIEAILTYYNTPQGQRYLALMSRLDGILGRGLTPPPGYDPKTSPAEPLPDEQQRALLEMMMLSRLMQAASAAQELSVAMHGDPSGFGGVAFMMTLGLRFHQPEAIALQAQYAADIPAFTEFEKTAAAHSLFRALGRAMFLPQQPPTRVFDEIVEKAQLRHGQDWRAFYRSETGHTTTTE